MKNLKLGKKDVFWSYVAQFLSMGVGVITLPFILNKLSTDEIGLNYILITVGGVIALVDLGFAQQFAINFTYVFSGAKELKKEGVGETGEATNYELLGYLLKSARHVYGVLATFAFVLLLAIGTPYIYRTTAGFTSVPNAMYVWIIYSLGVLFQIYYSYYFSMLIGAGKIKEQKYAIIGNKLLYMLILISGLYMGMGLVSVSLAQMISPFFGRMLAYRYFYSDELKRELDNHSTSDRKRIIEIVKVLWHNAKRAAVMQIGAYAILRFSMFIAGLYLSLAEFASYGLMFQLVGILGMIACTFVQISQPKFANLRARRDNRSLIAFFSMTLVTYYIIYLVGSIVIVGFGDSILGLINANVMLPSRPILLIFCIVMFLEYNHSNFAVLIGSNNKVPFAPASIITGIAVCTGAFLVLKFTTWGILGLVLVQGVCQAAYQNWKWPLIVIKEFHTSIPAMIWIGGKEVAANIRRLV